MEERPAEPTTRRGSKKRLLLCVTLFVVVLTTGSLLFWRIQQPQSLLPEAITAQIQDFTPYFYIKQIPAGYSLDNTRVSFNHGVLIIPLTKPGNATITLNEQKLPTGLSDPDIQQNGEVVEGTISPATINDIEGRLLGTMLASVDHTMVLLNASGDTTKDDLTALLRGLQPIH